ncbi:MAG TPA: hypothetical protein VFO69_10145 [Allosphingosinicella sp.]|nr:hypothetical protein [Allosphingosinicella sp.]
MRLWDAMMASASGVEDDGSYDSPNGPEDCDWRRAEALRVTPEVLGLPEEYGDRPYGIIVEAGSFPRPTTIVAFANGRGDLHLHDGDGMIGRLSHVHVVVQARRLVETAAEYVEVMEPTDSYPQAAPGMMRFYVLTRNGVLTAEASTSELRSGRSPLSPLLAAADVLMSEFLQYRLGRDIPLLPTTPAEFAKAVALVVLFAALTFGAWQIPIGWLRWTIVTIGAFLTIAALIVPVSMVAAPRMKPEKRRWF